MSTIADALARYSTHRRGWDFEFRTTGSLWWSHASLEDACEYFARLINTPIGKMDSVCDMTEFSVETVAIMLSYLDRYTKPVPVAESREYLEECLVASDRYGVADLKSAIITELENNQDEEYAELAKKYGIVVRLPRYYVPTFGMYPTDYQPSGHVNYSRICDTGIRYADSIGHALIKKIKFMIGDHVIDEWTPPKFGSMVSSDVPRFGDYFSDITLGSEIGRDLSTTTPTNERLLIYNPDVVDDDALDDSIGIRDW